MTSPPFPGCQQICPWTDGFPEAGKTSATAEPVPWMPSLLTPCTPWNVVWKLGSVLHSKSSGPLIAAMNIPAHVDPTNQTQGTDEASEAILPHEHRCWMQLSVMMEMVSLGTVQHGSHFPAAVECG